MGGVDPITATVISVLAFYGTLGSIVLIVFEWVRKNKAVYQPRKLSSKLKYPHNLDLEGFFQWVPDILSLSDTETLEIIGYDSFVFLRFVRLMVNISFFCFVTSFAGLIPIYYTAPFDELNASINRLSMANLGAGDDRLWAPVCYVWLYTLYFCYLLHIEYKEFSDLRQQYFSKPGDDFPVQSSYSCLVENLPPSLATYTEVKGFFDEIYPGDVHSVCTTQNLKHIEVLMAERERAIRQYERAVAVYEGSNHAEIPMVNLDDDNQPVYCCGGEKVSAIVHLKSEIIRLTARIQSEQWILHNSRRKEPLLKQYSSKRSPLDSLGDGAMELLGQYDPTKLASNCFVTFKSIRTKIAACQMAVVYDAHPTLCVSPACSPDDIIWTNIATSKTHSTLGGQFVAVILTLGLLFWGAIITFIGAISNLDSLANIFPLIHSLNPALYTFLSGLLPVIALGFFLSLLPAIFSFMATNIQQLKSTSSVEEFVCKWYFRYNLTNVYLTLLAGSLLSLLGTALADPNAVIEAIGGAIPAVSVFFINYMLSELLYGVPMNLARLSNFIIAYAYTKMFSQAKLSIRDFVTGPLAKENFDYGSQVPYFLFFVIIVLLYWVIAPVIMGVGFLLFGFQYLTFKYQFLYIFVPKYQSGGQYFYVLYRNSMIGLIISSVAIIGLMGIKEGISQAPFLLPLPIVVALIWNRTETLYRALSENMAMNVASSKDNDRFVSFRSNSTQPLLKNDESSVAPTQFDISSSFDSTFYEQPEFKDANASHKVLPYRILDTPLFNTNMELNEEYFDIMDLSAEELDKYHPMGQKEKPSDSLYDEI